MITKKTANSPMNTAITGAVLQPGATFPYSEFRGFNNVPKGVVIAVSADAFVDRFDVPVAIIKKTKNCFTFLNIEIKKSQSFD